VCVVVPRVLRPIGIVGPSLVVVRIGICLCAVCMSTLLIGVITSVGFVLFRLCCLLISPSDDSVGRRGSSRLCAISLVCCSSLYRCGAGSRYVGGLDVSWRKLAAFGVIRRPCSSWSLIASAMLFGVVDVSSSLSCVLDSVSVGRSESVLSVDASPVVVVEPTVELAASSSESLEGM
jgi:hypothetical protein